VSTSKPVRLQDIADRAGISRAAVSLALRNHASIPAQTRARVEALARELGYRPNPLVSALMSYQRSTRERRKTHLALALIVNFSRRSAWGQYLSEDLLSTAAARAEQHGYNLDEFWLGDLKLSPQRLGSVLFQRNVPGLIVAPLPAPQGELALDWSRFASVAIGYSLSQPRLHRVTTNRFQAMRLAVGRLLERGYTRLGLAMHENQDARVNHQWGAAFVWEQQQLPLRDRTVPFIVEEQEWNFNRFRLWYDQNGPEVVLGYDPTIVQWLKRIGRQVPDNTGFVHLWNPDRTGTFAGIYHDPPAIGAAAVDFLVGMIQRNERGLPAAPQTLLLEATWLNGATLRDPPRKSKRRRAAT